MADMSLHVLFGADILVFMHVLKRLLSSSPNRVIHIMTVTLFIGKVCVYPMSKQ